MRKLNTKEHTKLSNQSLVFEAFGEDEKLTVAQVTERLNDKAKAVADVTALVSDRTVRRAIEELVGKGFLRPYGRTQNSMTYGKLSAAMTADENERLIPFGGSLSPVSEWLHLMADMDSRPLKLKSNLLNVKAQAMIRRQMLFVVLTAGTTGHEDSLRNASKSLHETIRELEFVLDTVKGFIDSPVWYEQYRDRIGYALRKVIENDPDIIKLATDYVKSEA
jgi:hypothetical protein